MVGDVLDRLTDGAGDRLKIEVVLADEDDRNLQEAGQVQPFVEVAASGGAVAEEADHHVVGLLHLHRPTYANGLGDLRAHHRGARQNAQLRVSAVVEGLLPGVDAPGVPHDGVEHLQHGNAAGPEGLGCPQGR